MECFLFNIINKSPFSSLILGYEKKMTSTSQGQSLHEAVINPSHSGIRTSDLSPFLDSSPQSEPREPLHFPSPPSNFTTDDSGRRVSPRHQAAQPTPTPPEANITNMVVDSISTSYSDNNMMVETALTSPATQVLDAPVSAPPSILGWMTDIPDLEEANNELPSHAEAPTDGPAQYDVPQSIVATSVPSSDPSSLDMFLAIVAEVRSSSLGDSVADRLLAFAPTTEPTIGSIMQEIGSLKDILTGRKDLTVSNPSAPAVTTSFATLASQQGGWSTKRPRTAPAPVHPQQPTRSTVLTRNSYALLAKDPSSGGLSDLDHRRVLGQEPQSHSGPLTAVFVMGISKPESCSSRFVSDYLHHERKFDRDNALNTTYLGDGLSELVIPQSSVAALEDALADSSISLFRNFNPMTPLSRNSSPEKARAMFSNRMDNTLTRLKAAPNTRRVAALILFFEAYRKTGENTPSIVVENRQDYIRSALSSSLLPSTTVQSSPITATTTTIEDVTMDSSNPVVSAPAQGTEQ